MTFMTITYRAFSCLWERTSPKRVLTCVCYGLVILLGTMAHSVVNAQVYDFGQSKECTIIYFDALKDRDLRVAFGYPCGWQPKFWSCRKLITFGSHAVRSMLLHHIILLILLKTGPYKCCYNITLH